MIKASKRERDIKFILDWRPYYAHNAGDCVITVDEYNDTVEMSCVCARNLVSTLFYCYLDYVILSGRLVLFNKILML